MKNVRLSVILTSFNNASDIANVLNSLDLQDFKDFELILIDDASSDETVKVALDILKKSNINHHIYVNKIHKGFSASRNYGISIAKGDYIIFVEPDSLLNLNYISSLLFPFLASSLDFDSVMLKGLKLDDKNGFIGFSADSYDDIRDFARKNNRIINSSDLIKFILNMDIPFCFNLLIYKKEIILKNNIFFDEDLDYNEGFDFAVRYLSLSSNVLFVNKYSYYKNVKDKRAYLKSLLESFLHIKSLQSLALYFNELHLEENPFYLLDEKIKTYTIPKFVMKKINSLIDYDYPKDEIKGLVDELALSNHLKIFKLQSKADYKLKLMIDLCLTNFNLYYSFRKRLHNSEDKAYEESIKISEDESLKKLFDL